MVRHHWEEDANMEGRSEKVINALTTVGLGVLPFALMLAAQIGFELKSADFNPECSQIISEASPEDAIDIVFAPQDFSRGDMPRIIDAINRMEVSYRTTLFDRGKMPPTNFSVVEDPTIDYGTHYSNKPFQRSAELTNKIAEACDADFVVILDNVDDYIKRGGRIEYLGLAQINGNRLIVGMGKDGQYYRVFPHEMGHTYGLTHPKDPEDNARNAMSTYVTSNIMSSEARQKIQDAIQKRFGSLKPMQEISKK